MQEGCRTGAKAYKSIGPAHCRFRMSGIGKSGGHNCWKEKGVAALSRKEPASGCAMEANGSVQLIRRGARLVNFIVLLIGAAS